MTTNAITREDLEMAAKAAGIDVKWCRNGSEGEELECFVVKSSGTGIYLDRFEPDKDDGDCARMCAAVGIDTEWFDDCVDTTNGMKLRCVTAYFDDHANDKCAARRYASVKLAAAVGRGM